VLEKERFNNLYLPKNWGIYSEIIGTRFLMVQGEIESDFSLNMNSTDPLKNRSNKS